MRGLYIETWPQETACECVQWQCDCVWGEGWQCVGGGRDESVRLWYQYRESNFKLYSLLPSNWLQWCNPLLMWSPPSLSLPAPSGLTPVVWSRWPTLVSLRTSTPRTTSDRGKRMLRCGCPSGGWHLRAYKMASSLRRQTWWVEVGRLLVS